MKLDSRNEKQQKIGNLRTCSSISGPPLTNSRPLLAGSWTRSMTSPFSTSSTPRWTLAWIFKVKESRFIHKQAWARNLYFSGFSDKLLDSDQWWVLALNFLLAFVWNFDLPSNLGTFIGTHGWKSKGAPIFVKIAGFFYDFIAFWLTSFFLICLGPSPLISLCVSVVTLVTH